MIIVMIVMTSQTQLVVKQYNDFTDHSAHPDDVLRM